MFPRRLILLPVAVVLLILAGTVGYRVLEGWPVFDCVYFTVVTLTTIGYGDVVPVTVAGKTFTMFLALGGIFTLFFAAAEVLRAVVSGEVQDILGRRRMEHDLAGWKNHFIVCGYGRVGQYVCRQFSLEKLRFVVIESEAELLEDFALPHGIALHGDATSDEVLRHAGVERARALVSVVASDADNLFITMSARLLNDQLLIVTRAGNEQCEKKLLRAGASRVISPYVIGGSAVAQAVLRPTVEHFIELATRTEHMELQIEETKVAPGSRLAGAALRDSGIRRELGIIIVAIKKPSGQMVFNPPSETVLEASDILITLGHRQQLHQLEKLAAG